MPKPKVSNEQKDRMYRMWRDHGVTFTALAKQYGIGKTTIARFVREREAAAIAEQRKNDNAV
ncbi:hypothetical protein D3C76_650730 [compost metagenome]